MSERKALKTQEDLTEMLPLLTSSKRNSTKRRWLSCTRYPTVDLVKPSRLPWEVPGPHWKHQCSKRKKMETAMGDSGGAALDPLCLHAFAHAVPLAQNALP